MDECVELARRFGAHIAERFELPVYLYAKAATRAERIILADIRKPQYEGLKTDISHLGREPDFGPTRMHPSAGAVAVGARPFLIAFNINLESSDVDLAKRIAHRIRERSGGLPRVQALGLYLDDIQRAQVSMNLLDHMVTLPGWSGRRSAGWQLTKGSTSESELIGLAPLAAYSTSPTTSAWRPRTDRVAPDGRGRVVGHPRFRADHGPSRAWRRRPATAGVTLRVPGGAELLAPGLPIRGASEVVTMSGGLRMGSAQDDVVAITATEP